ncbi:phosphoenolpyruvate--protein phosphotransferase [Yinghuangia sp. ASG 101]|uniref:dihydroxyacetone kinase phosphoryl donor subunit DhaM n=1 Tax=Yinghuangia sp. ASG 101 TaxID=2896848 RepID=UPI001E61E714|nr:dihydroxyacetone kinase phosphoryl donor subunit DhaM [Yinghuangia sp. ASG 101]UGQ13497.1 phosphoenolpyruvate--protein phosphotransferase [Yinghuangia sp. ASG 101]
MNAPVGIVLVSHSAELASGLRLLVEQIGAQDVPIATAGGTDDGRVGTSYDLVLAAVRDADHGGGVVVLPDLGSSVLTARAVLADHPRPDVVIVDAPFVEGAVAAAVTAASGADLKTVADAAQEARHVHKL